ncbi:MAG: COG1361 S-layer family protein, partial [Candidatus Nanohaloarchaea archaeon]|nr:COG1361 S-layer family protein [Candidatus Nanohaloarchaea archaeon]
KDQPGQHVIPMNTAQKILTLLTAIILLQSLVAAVEVRKIRTEPAPLQAAEYADVWIKVVNERNHRVNISSITFVADYPFHTDPGVQTRYEIGTMFPNEEYRFHFQLKVDENAVHGTNHLKFRIRQQGEPGYTTKRIPVEIRDDSSALVFKDVAFPEEIRPGTTALLNLTLMNSGSSHLKNIDVSIDLSGNQLPFAPAETTTERIGSLAPGETTTTQFKIHAPSDASSGIYKLPIRLSYENEGGTSFQQTDLTGIAIGGRPVLATGLNEIQIRKAGTSGSITLRIINKGEERAKYVSMQLQDTEKYHILSPSSVYLGNMDPDDYQTAEFRLYVEKGVQNISIPVSLEYRNSESKTKTETQHIPVKLYSAQELSRFGIRSSSSSRTLYAAIILAALITGYIYWRRRG